VRVIAILAVRNERPYLANCLNHLIDNGLDFAVIDNESTDGTRALLREQRFVRRLTAFRSFPFDGTFDWTGLMRAREEIALYADADWVVFVSADEIMHSYVPGETLSAALARIAAQGFDVVDFNEFVFLPVDGDYVPDCAEPQPLRHYYFFEPARPRLMRARRTGLDVSHVEAGGHVLEGQSYRLSPETFALRHYLFRDQAHASAKYAGRTFRPDELVRGWHGNRVGVPPSRFILPPKSALHCLDRPEDRNLRRDRPRATHYWQWMG
jgi:glycosyltransferase involved in cell wall biosynthesis